MDTILEFFLGTPPVGFEGIYYVFRCLIGFVLFDFLLDIFRFGRTLLKGGERR